MHGEATGMAMQAADQRYRGASGTTQAPPRPPLIDGATERVQQARKEIEDLRLVVGTFVENTLGSEPNLGQVGADKRSEPHTRGEVLDYQLEELHASIRELRNQVNRLARV